MYIDIFLGVFVLIGLVQGYYRGILRSVFALLGFVAGVLAVMKFSPHVVSLLDNIFHWDPILSMVIGVALTFVLIMWGIRWLGRGLEKTLKAARLNFINKALGAALFTGIMVLAFAGIIWFIDKTELISDAQKESSRSYPYLVEIPQYASDAFKSIEPVFREFWEKLDEVVESRN